MAWRYLGEVPVGLEVDHAHVDVVDDYETEQVAVLPSQPRRKREGVA